MAKDAFDPLSVFCSAFAISSLGGLATLLRSRKALTWRGVAATSLYSGLTGLAIALVWFNSYNEAGNVYFLLGVSAFAGIGGMTVLDFVVQSLKAGGITIRVKPDEPD